MTEPFKSEAEEFSADENEEEILADEEAQDEEDLPPPLEDELMSNSLMSDLSSLNPPPSNSQTQHKSLFDCMKRVLSFLLIFLF